jgi:tetratricopeptide (TPR) repeat protein
MRILFLVLAIALASFTVMAGGAAASGPDGPLLARLMASGDHDGARAHLAAAVSEPALHALHRTHLEGLIARQQGKPGDAVALFRAVLAIDPDFAAARVELARTLLAMRSFEGAQHHLDILALNVNDEIRSLAHSGLDHIRANRGYGAQMHFSIAPSTNLNRGSAHQTFVAGGLAFAIDPGSRQTAGASVTIGGSAYNSFTLGNGQAIVASAAGDLTTDIEGARAEQVVLNAGLSWQGRSGNSRFALGPIADVTYWDFEPHLMRYGLSGTLDVPAGPQDLVGLSFTVLGQDYASQTYRNGFRVLANAQLTHGFTPALRASVETGLDIERTQSAHLDRDGVYGEVRVASDWRGGFSTSAFARYARDQYRGNYPGTGAPRVDDRLSAGVTISNSQVDLGGFTPTLGYSYTRQFSNVSFFDHDSHDVSVGLTKAF